MFGFTGEMRYSTNNSGRYGEPVFAEFHAAFFPGQFSVTVRDEGAGAIRELKNRRFDSQARDSPEDLLARDKWRSNWFDKFTGNLNLKSPRVNGVTRDLTDVTVTCSWDSAFCVVEYRTGDTFYQFSRRPPRGFNRWARRNISWRNQEPDDSPPDNEPSSSSNLPPIEVTVIDAPTPAMSFRASPSPIGGGSLIRRKSEL